MSRFGADAERAIGKAGQHRSGTVELAGRLSLLPERRARHHVKQALDGLGRSYDTVPFTGALRLPVAWQVRVKGTAPGSGWITVPSAAAVGSPTCREVEGPVTYVGTGGPMEYKLGGEMYRGGIVLAALRAVPTRQVILTARDHGALAVLMYHPHASSVQAVTPDAHLPLPAATISRGAATALARHGGTARIDVGSEELCLSFENIFVRRGEGPLHIVVVGRYDSRPRRLGPGGRSLGLAAMLSLLATLEPPADRRITFAILDGEELGSLGSARYDEDLRNDATEPPDLVVNLNALGTRRDLGVEVRDPRGDGRDLRELALQAFQAAGLSLAPRNVEHLFYGGSERPRIGWPVVVLGGRPRQRIPCGDAEQGIPDRWGVSRLVGPIARIVCEAKP